MHIPASLLAIAVLLSFFAGTTFGWWSYRRTLKKDPAKLEALAREIKLRGEAFGLKKGPNQ